MCMQKFIEVVNEAIGFMDSAQLKYQFKVMSNQFF